MGRSSGAQWENSITHHGSRRSRSGFGNMRRNGTSGFARNCGSRSQPTRFRVPDVTLLDRDQPIEQIITHPPLAVFEVLSPEDRVQLLKRKLEDYRSMGIPQIWVIDPQDDTFSRYTERQLLLSDSFSLAGRGITFNMSQIKDLLD
jgi:Uma2 family endonuclease